MAVQKQDGLHTDTAVGAVDLTGKEEYFCSRDANGELVITGAAGRIDGVISEGKIAGKHSSFNTPGNPILRVIAGAAIAQNARVCSDATGRAVTGLTNSFGRARKAVSAAGVIAEIIPEYYDADGA